MSSDADRDAELARKVAVRRVKRRLKAAASIGLALMAGAFLACTPNKPLKERSRVPVPPNPTTPSSGALPAPSAQATAEPTPIAPSASAASSAPSAPTSSAIVPARKSSPPKAPAVDKQEHRKGMPVPDNLLE